ncbi:MAG: zinc-binding dehydrogenase [Sciscionella sp.]
MFDVVVDPVGGSTRQLSLEALTMGGRLVAMGNASGGDDLQVSANTLWLRGKGILGFNLGGLSASDPSTVEPSLRRAVAEVFSGTLHVNVTRELALAEAATAHEALESGATTGKMVLFHG